MKQQVRPSGGMRMAFQDEFSEKDADAQALQAAAQQQTVQNAAAAVQPVSTQTQQQARPVGSLTEELFKRPVADVGSELKTLFDIQSILGIKAEDTPEEKAKKQRVAQNFAGLTQEDQAEAQRQFEERIRKQQQAEKEEEERQKALAAQEEESFEVPKSVQKGFQGMNAHQKASTTIQNSRHLDQGNINSAG